MPLPNAFCVPKYEILGLTSDISLQPSRYITTLLVPKDGQIPIDIKCLAAQGIFNVVSMPFALFCRSWQLRYFHFGRELIYIK